MKTQLPPGGGGVRWNPNRPREGGWGPGLEVDDARGALPCTRAPEGHRGLGHRYIHGGPCRRGKRFAPPSLKADRGASGMGEVEFGGGSFVPRVARRVSQDGGNKGNSRRFVRAPPSPSGCRMTRNNFCAAFRVALKNQPPGAFARSPRCRPPNRNGWRRAHSARLARPGRRFRRPSLRGGVEENLQQTEK